MANLHDLTETVLQNVNSNPGTFSQLNTDATTNMLPVMNTIINSKSKSNSNSNTNLLDDGANSDPVDTSSNLPLNLQQLALNLPEALYKLSDYVDVTPDMLSTHSETFKYKVPTSDKLYTARRNPAFAFTSHNSQGRTLETACIDLASCVSIQSAYVMRSRLTSLKGLCILRPFA